MERHQIEVITYTLPNYKRHELSAEIVSQTTDCEILFEAAAYTNSKTSYNDEF